MHTRAEEAEVTQHIDIRIDLSLSIQCRVADREAPQRGHMACKTRRARRVFHLNSQAAGAAAT